MRTRRLASVLVVAAVASALLVSRDRLFRPSEAQPSETPVARPAVATDVPLRAIDCTTQVALPGTVDRVLSLSQSPDGLTLAIGRHLDLRAFSRSLIKERADPTLQHIQLIDLRSLRIVEDIGAGIGPLWSGSGRYLSYHVPQGSGEQLPTDLVVFDVSAHREIARLHTTDAGGAEAGWDGDSLVYLNGADVHRWEPTGDRVMSTIPAAYLPLSGFPVLSADGHAFANPLGWDGTAPFNAFVIEATTGRTTMLTGLRSLHWSRAGHRLLASYNDHRDLIDEDGTVRRADVPFVATSVEWSSDGRQPLFVDPVPTTVTTYPAKRTFTDFDGRPTRITVPMSVSGSFDRAGRRYVGRWWDGYSAPELRVYDCSSI